jgi:hypothetical protein
MTAGVNEYGLLEIVNAFTVPTVADADTDADAELVACVPVSTVEAGTSFDGS